VAGTRGPEVALPSASGLDWLLGDTPWVRGRTGFAHVLWQGWNWF
jgi:hypothetical protein